jgi:hypothetical protein
MPRNLYTEDEITLCTYIAIYGTNDFNENTIHTKYGIRSLSSIQMKIQNIAAMLDEDGITRYSGVKGLTGKTTGETGRRTNWDWVEKSIQFSKDNLLSKCKEILNS